MRDLLPYLDQPIPANSTDIKDFVTAIMPNIAKPLCISLEERKRVRHFILEASRISCDENPQLDTFFSRSSHVSVSKLLSLNDSLTHLTLRMFHRLIH